MRYDVVKYFEIQNPLKKPVLYKTIVQIYLVISIGFVLFSTHILNEEFLRDGGVHPLTAMFLVGIVLVVGFTTFLGGLSFILLFFNKKIGVYLSFASLTLLFFVFGFSVSGYMDTLSDFNSLQRDPDLRKVIEYLTMGFSGTIFLSLYLAWKKINWK